MVDCFISYSNTTEVNFYLLLFASITPLSSFHLFSKVIGKNNDQPSQVIEDTLRDEDPLILRRKNDHPFKNRSVGKTNHQNGNRQEEICFP